MQLYIRNHKIVFVSYLCCYFVRTTNTCNKIKALQYELIYISSVPTQLGGGGGAAPKLCHIRSPVIFFWEQMMTEHRGLSVYIAF